MINTIVDIIYHLMNLPVSIVDCLFVNAQKYPFPPWETVFPDKTVTLQSLIYDLSWNEFFESVCQKSYYTQLEALLTANLKAGQLILPYPHLVFNMFNLLPLSKISVVIIGQDPYINTLVFNNKRIPQATGCSFSVPMHYPIPPSLINIYKNMMHFKQLSKMPINGNLATWMLQGVFMINTSLTTLNGQSNAHQKRWTQFTRDWLLYMNEKCENIVFLIWGKHAYEACQVIDPQKHHLIITSHPSPYSYDRTFKGTNKLGLTRNYPAFKDVDHFKQTNIQLTKIGKPAIVWDLIDID